MGVNQIMKLLTFFNGKNSRFKATVAFNIKRYSAKPADGFKDIFKDAMRGEPSCKSAGTP